MFQGVEYRFPYLTPPLTTEMVRDSVVSILASNRSQDVMLPFFVRTQPLLKALPIEISDWLRRVIENLLVGYWRE
jgi:hypothetical protein